MTQAQSHADLFTAAVCRLFPGPYAAKRMADVFRCSVRTCEEHIQRRRAISLDAAIEMAARDERALAALMERVEAAAKRNAELHEALGQRAGGGMEMGVGTGGRRVGSGGGGVSVGGGAREAAAAPGQAAAGQHRVAGAAVSRPAGGGGSGASGAAAGKRGVAEGGPALAPGWAARRRGAA